MDERATGISATIRHLLLKWWKLFRGLASAAVRILGNM